MASSFKIPDNMKIRVKQYWDQVRQGDTLIKPNLGRVTKPLEWFYDDRWPSIYVKCESILAKKRLHNAFSASLLDAVFIEWKERE